MKELYTAAGIFVVLILLGVWMVQNNRNEQEKKLVQLRKKWGKKQEKRTAREKKEKLEACLRRKAGENFCVDAITWNDLDLDAVFDTVDHTVSVCGEEYLYTALRMPVTTTEIREERERLMKLFAENQKAREAVQKALLLMGKEKMNPPTEEIAVLMEAEPGEKGKYLLMAGIAVLGIGLLFVLPPLGVSVLFASMVGNGLMHGRESKKLESALKAFGCILRLQRTARELGKEKNFRTGNVSEASGRTGKTTPSDYKKMQNTCEYERIAGRCSKHDFCILSHVLSAGSDRVFFGCFRSEIV